MATRSWINDAQWFRVQAVLAAQPRRGRPGADDRRLFEAVVWWRRAGVPCRDLPDEFGPWQTVFNRFDRGHGGFSPTRPTAPTTFARCSPQWIATR